MNVTFSNKCLTTRLIPGAIPCHLGLCYGVLKTEKCSAREDIIILQVQGQGFSSDPQLQALLLGQKKQGIGHPKASPIHLPKTTPIGGSLHQVIQVFLPNDFRHAYVVPRLRRLELSGS